MRTMVLIILAAIVILFTTVEIYLHFSNDHCEPFFDKKTRIIKRERNNEGTYKTETTNTGYFKINNEGWNSHRDYFQRTSKYDKKLRIAIVGHSNVEGLRVNINKTLSKVFEDELLQNGIEAEVYTFGYGGMHLAQALHVSRYVVKNYEPDILIIGTFLDDYLYKKTDKESFLSLSFNGNNKIVEVLPIGYEGENSSPLSFLFFSRIIKNADIKFKLGKKINIFFSKNTRKTRTLNDDILIKDSNYAQNIYLTNKYILEEFKKISQQSQYKPNIYFIDFPYKIPSFNYNTTNEHSSVHQYHKKLIEQICKSQFTIISIKQALLDDYTENHKKFDFYNDLHYNQHAHSIIGKTLAKYFMENILSNKK